MESEQGRHRGLIIFAIFVLGCALSYSLGRAGGQLDQKEALMSQPLPELQTRDGAAFNRLLSPESDDIEVGSAQ